MFSSEDSSLAKNSKLQTCGLLAIILRCWKGNEERH